MRFRFLLPTVFALPLLGLAATAPPARAQDGDRLARLTHHVDGSESLRAIKRLQYAYAQFQAAGLWAEAASLFADQGELVLGPAGDRAIRGPKAVADHLRTTYGGGTDGLPPGGLQLELEIAPVVSLSADGLTAKGRWHTVSMRGRFGGAADWAGDIQENTYVKQGGVWKIARLHIHPQWAGPYDAGWRNMEDDLKIVPFHYQPAEVGRPIPRGAAARPATLAALEPRLAALADEDAVRNLQNAYGYYVDRRMWDDVADLFTAGGSLTVADLGTYVGPKSIRRGLEIDGPAGLGYGQMNDHIQLNTVITVAKDGRTASARGIDLGMTSAGDGKAWWSAAVFENRYVKQGGTWRVAAMRLYPLMKADYALGWAKSAAPPPSPAAGLAPDRPAAAADRGAQPSFSFVNPVTGRAVGFPAGAKVARIGALASSGARSAVTGALPQRLDAAERDARAAIAYDATENLSAAFGNYVDDFQWDDLGQLFAARGEREAPGVGTYITPARISLMQTTRYGPMRTPRTSIPVHLRTQPVIHVSADGRSAKARMRLLQFNSSLRGSGTIMTGMYEDEVVLEDGAWKLGVIEIDHILRTTTYKDGWAKVPDSAGRGSAPPAGALFAKLPPDRPLVGEPFATFPAVGRMWFHYRNPVSGRSPPLMTPKPVAAQTLATSAPPAAR
jgi:hypothetical protein